MSFKCFNCQKDVDAKNLDRRIICPYCSSRILVKARPNVIKKVKAR